MEVLDALQSRRSYRNFDPNYVIPKEEVKKIIDLALQSPTGCNLQGIDLLVITDRKKIDEASKILYDSWDEDFQKKLDTRKQDGCTNVVTCDASCLIIMVSNERAQEQFQKIDAGIMCMSIMSSARAFNLDSLCLGCFLAGDKKGVEQYFGIGEGKLTMAICIGKSKDRSKVPPKDQLCKATYIE
ncbi:nitroreductase family protein [Histomonas meleagridis]|uniref:nitroreductase family protein n=1 Tax=Histomonas meleagridis TaxID=135588 RepID=UPI00355A135C|nr:nitroreductase family protein [Histomonas meleagridis]KAH0799780.1 nitroreductase family protein [Histomonas meleagridis]